ncbi:major facilitator superfamily domain-containing protein [Yarrowia lipolytica]|jgi:hypothetical protein|uniref:YALI0D24772p n=2 Tax=Yarrowia lipolytica TaxID=4952 RepID=Q6C7W7_YARLI|nr:YALI0D24772p [Yarrowia lipolytica CLIB122]AOW04599.1 hypothetical protein YALI1_D32812g [Yarrowia lipolytica]KAB8283877.1 major facilitator superfamily domain-containing protein [Yarrowia lipolytica]KAE8170888.1 major facilitator superfamily domain-containing protein [Yarrowia lipolytica]KAJ8053962.1 major facilitator superfamily domain-containing protein [Yarrowia lipolytica]QNP98207.1 Hypothetical protein YALI2_D00648g [Yarrowia lipolytica]|eukprot:XP_503245.1 YALI0D24772p [Yarrowia lipolytica CLIB122]
MSVPDPTNALETTPLNPFHNPWREQSPWRIIRPLSVAFLATAIAGVIGPNFLLATLCKHYYDGREGLDPDSLTISNPLCQISHLQVQAGTNQSRLNLCRNVVALIVFPRLSAWSDRRGRKPILKIAAGFTLVSLTLQWCVQHFWRWFPVPTFILAGCLDLSAVVFQLGVLAIADSTCRRTVNTSYLFVASYLFTALGSYVGSELAKRGLSTLAAVYVPLYLVFFIWTWFVSETLPYSERDKATEVHNEKTDSRRKTLLYYGNPLQPLAALLSPAHRRIKIAMVIFAAACALEDTFYQTSQYVTLLYIEYRFKWTSIQLGKMQAASAAVSLVMVCIAPFILRELEKRRNPVTQDIHVLRTAAFWTASLATIKALAGSVAPFVVAHVLLGLRAVADSPHKSVAMALAPSAAAGQVLGALEMAVTLVKIPASTVLVRMYSWTVYTNPAAVLWIICFGEWIAFAFFLALWV